MRTLTWDRTRVIDRIRERIWLYLSPASRSEDLALDASALLQLSEMDVLTMARVYFVLSNEVRALLDVVPALLRRLPTNLAQMDERSTERVRGAVRWQQTLLARAATGLPNLFVTTPTERAYETPENQLLVFMLAAVARVAQETGWDGSAGSAGNAVAQRGSEASRWLSSRMLHEVPVMVPAPRSVARVRSGRHGRRFMSALAAFERYQSLVEHLDESALRQVIEEQGLIVQPDGTLFEILCLFEVIDALEALGLRRPTLRVFQGGLHCELRDAGRIVDLWYQTTPKELGASSAYVETLRAHRFASPVDLRPDIVLRLREGGATRWLVVETKTGLTRNVAASARRALADLLSYRSAFGSVLASSVPPFGLGIAWGAELEPVCGPMMLCTPDRILDALWTFFSPEDASH